MKVDCMHRVLLRLLVFEILERICRFESLLEEYDASLNLREVSVSGIHSLGSPFANGLYRKLASVKQHILLSSNQWESLFTDNLEQNGSWSRAQVQLLVSQVQQAQNSLNELSRLFSRAARIQPRSELSIFLKDAMPLSFLPNAHGLEVLLLGEEESLFVQPLAGGSQATSSQPLHWPLEDILPAPLSILQVNNPMAWVSLVKPYAASLFTAQSNDWLDATKQGRVPPLPENLRLDTAAEACIALRLLGPAYYYQQVSQALLYLDVNYLYHMEPLLFQALNYFSYTDKTLVILHEAVEKTIRLLSVEDSFPVQAGKTAMPEVVDALLHCVEALIPNRYAFTEKHFQRALKLQERLTQETFLSATPLYSPEELHEALARFSQNGPGEAGSPSSSDNIYSLLAMTTETPHAPREIITAGWVTKLDRLSVWLYDALNSPEAMPTNGLDGPAANTLWPGMARFKDRLERQDHLLLKSVETSEIHRVLLCGAPEEWTSRAATSVPAAGMPALR
ncbi:MAG: hypothetical protein SFZ03_03335 [Candidatus Melainabacteria bacterium]|nr:hypothetical protein [Candidatus Melainabacteria bacterium]